MSPDEPAAFSFFPDVLTGQNQQPTESAARPMLTPPKFVVV
jgi:hypothetical protein